MTDAVAASSWFASTKFRERGLRRSPSHEGEEPPCTPTRLTPTPPASGSTSASTSVLADDYDAFPAHVRAVSPSGANASVPRRLDRERWWPSWGRASRSRRTSGRASRTPLASPSTLSCPVTRPAELGGPPEGRTGRRARPSPPPAVRRPRGRPPGGTASLTPARRGATARVVRAAPSGSTTVLPCVPARRGAHTRRPDGRDGGHDLPC